MLLFPKDYFGRDQSACKPGSSSGQAGREGSARAALIVSTRFLPDCLVSVHTSLTHHLLIDEVVAT